MINPRCLPQLFYLGGWGMWERRLGATKDETFDGLWNRSCQSWYQLISLDITDEYLSMLNDLCNLHDTRWLAINWLSRVQATIDPQSHLPPQAEMPRLNCGSAAKRPFSGGCTRGVSRSWQCWAWMLMVEAPPKSKVRRDEFEQHMKPEAMSPEKKIIYKALTLRLFDLSL